MLSFSFTSLLRRAGSIGSAMRSPLKRSVATRSLALVAVSTALCTLSLFGCGGSGSSATQAGSQVSFPGRYASDVPLSSGQTGHIDMTVSSDGNAAATLNIDTSASRQAASPTRAVVATYMLVGTANLQKGTFTLEGTVVSASGATPILASGSLPSSGLGGLLNLLFNNNSYKGSLSRSGSDSTIGGTVGTGPNSTVNFAGAMSSNANTASYSGVTAVAVQNLPIIGSTASIIVALPNGQRQVTININAPLTAGAIFVPGDEKTIVQVVDGTKLWNGAGGQVIIDAVSGTSVNFRVLNVPMSPFPVIGSGASASGSTGTFVLSVNAAATAPAGNPGGIPAANSLIISGLTANTTIAKNGAFTATILADKFTGQYSYAIIKDPKAAMLTEFSGDIFTTAVGQTIDLASAGAGNLAYQEGGSLFFQAVSGTVSIDAATSTSVTVTIHNARFLPQSGGTGTTGELTLNGSFTAPVTNH